ncbi:MAG TPA: hypothetical protein H9873_07755 [Candidatus Dorea gallistercoris]|uniref:Bypass of forespore C C-terminal domain-containing protein n=1 Tax=Candidatus Dorea gallistercoris TaxID=2838542 RepID=A0A9D1RB47_9FIRM|nr:hypothetical protein [Candidatus Dorea gallistercoris]
MKNKYGIGFFAVAIIAVLVITCAYQFTFQKAKEKAQAQTEEETQEQNPSLEEEESVTADGAALKEDCYYLMEVNGYIVVYLSDRQTPYEYTDIRFDDLPASLREEVRNGKYVEGEAQLYGFLENYSS